MLTQAPRGTRDMLPKESAAWQWIEGIEREVCARHHVREIRTPVFEHTELFLRGVGDTTDIVQKEMYTFEDKGGRSVTLKPEGTAGAVRAFVEHGLYNEPLPARMYYLNNPIFRYDAPQAGRYREHHQFGVEFFGSASPLTDAQTISLAMEVVTKVGLSNLELHINSIGCPECRPAYQETLRAHFQPNLDRMCKTCRERYERNPLRLIDCKEDICQPFKEGIPAMTDCLCGECAEHFNGLKEALDAIGLSYTVNPSIVRGLDYYTRTVFEIILPLEGGGEITVGAGGRYDRLVEMLGGPPIPAIGFGMGTERLILAAQQCGIELPKEAPTLLYIAPQNSSLALTAFSIANQIRAAGVSAESDIMGRSMKAQFKYCGKMNIPYVAALGGDEVSSGKVTVRDMRNGTEESVPIDELPAYAKRVASIEQEEAR